MDVLDAQAVADAFPQDGASGAIAQLGPIFDSNGGYYNVTDNPVFAQYAYGQYGEAYWTPAVPIPIGPAVLAPGTVGVRFKNYTAGKVAHVSGALSEKREPAVQITSGGIASTGGGASATVATSLPATPADGDQVALTDNVNTPTWVWLMQWNAAAGKWFCLGGTPAQVFVAAAEFRNSAAYGDTATVHQFIVPRAGVFDIEWGGYAIGLDVTSSFNLFASVAMGVTAASDTWGVECGGNVGPATGRIGQMPYEGRTVSPALALLDAIKVQSRQPSGASAASAGWQTRWLFVLPVYLT